MLKGLHSRTLHSLLAFFLLSSLSISSVNAQNVENGEKLFKANCSSCHQMGGVLVGPNLVGVEERWAGREELLYKFIKNSQEVINGGDEYSQKLYAQYNVVMPPMALNDEEVGDVLGYIKNWAPEVDEEPEVAGDGAPVSDDFLGFTYTQAMLILGLLLILFIGIIGLLLRISNKVRQLAMEKEGKVEEIKPSFIDEAIADIKYFLFHQMNRTILIGTVGIVPVLFALPYMWSAGQDLGAQIGYMPDQPIKFSHKLHVGQNQIDCQYCHTGVEKSKSANIPSPNICMNCHNHVKKGPKHGTKEIAKIYAAIGWDPDKREYTGETKPIEWVRVHNLPDHVYFSHAQHVSVGNLDCANCHGNVAEMEEIAQVATLEMGWCINCHRDTEVEIDNKFYREMYASVIEGDYAEYKDNNPTYEGDVEDFLKRHKKYTIADMGGLECQRCHY